MKASFSNLNIFGMRCDSRNDTKEQCSCISVVVPSKTDWLEESSENNIKDIIEISVVYWCVYLR